MPEVFEKFSSNVDVSLLDIAGLFKNLFSVITGSITVGGSCTFVAGFMYWFINVRAQRKKLKNKEEGD